jgi:hypothetical protein
VAAATSVVVDERKKEEEKKKRAVLAWEPGSCETKVGKTRNLIKSADRLKRNR